MEKIIKALYECDFAELYTEAIGISPDKVSAWEDGPRGNTLHHGWEVCIKHPFKQIGAVSAHDINTGQLPDCLFPYLKQGRFWPK